MICSASTTRPVATQRWRRASWTAFWLDPTFRSATAMSSPPSGCSLATDPRDFARLALRTRLCDQNADSTTGCVRDVWYSDTSQPSGVYDGLGSKGARGFGEDARATIDRLPLADRMALGADPTLPPELRLDIALTNFGRAVQLRDDAAVDALCRQLVGPAAANEERLDRHRRGETRSGPAVRDLPGPCQDPRRSDGPDRLHPTRGSHRRIPAVLDRLDHPSESRSVGKTFRPSRALSGRRLRDDRADTG